MCLSLTITLLSQYQNKAKDIAASASLEDGLQVWAEKRWFGRKPRYLFISDGQNSCACSFLTDNADWDADTWDMDLKLLSHLGATLSKLHNLMPEGFYFEALWAGDMLRKR